MTEWEVAQAKILAEGTASSTQRAHWRDLRYFWEWAALSDQGSITYPIPTSLLIGFVVEHAGYMPLSTLAALVEKGLKRTEQALSPRTIRRIVGSISYEHLRRGLTNPAADSQVRLLLKKYQASIKRCPIEKRPITADILQQLLETCDDSTLVGKRDKALLTIGFATGGRRRSELASLQVTDLIPIEDGYRVHLRHSKTDQEGEGAFVPLLGASAVAVKRWLLASGIRTGSLFRGIHRSGTILQGISGDTINRMIKKRAKAAGLDPAHFSAHSLRSGFMTQAARAGVHVRDAMKLSQHKDLTVAQHYYKGDEFLNNPASYLLVNPGQDNKADSQ